MKVRLSPQDLDRAVNQELDQLGINSITPAVGVGPAGGYTTNNTNSSGRRWYHHRNLPTLDMIEHNWE